jgi:transcriptional repressor NrdR
VFFKKGEIMKCPYCQHAETKVVDSREAEELVRRRRECEKCEKRFTTHEVIESAPLYVIKKDSSKELFDREKIKRGLLKACEKRPIEIEKIDDAIDKITSRFIKNRNNEVSSREIGEEAMKHLKKLDKIAYIRFASVYRQFEDPSDFKKELNNI